MKKSIIGSLCALSVLITGILGACSFNNVEQKVESTQIGSTIVTPEYTNAMRLNVAPLENEISPMSNPFIGEDPDFRITATVSSSSTLIDLTWKVEFVSPNSEWATGKYAINYVKVGQDTEYSNIAYVIVEKAFAEQIRIVVSSTYNSAISASIICDYKARLTGGDISLAYAGGGHSSASEWNVSMPDFGTKSETITLTKAHTGTRLIDYSLIYSDGTTFPSKEGWRVAVDVNCPTLYEALSAGHPLLPVRSDFSEISSSNTTGFSVRYKMGDEINLDLPGVDLLTEEVKRLVLHSRAYMLGYTDHLPDNWDDGEAYSAYCELMNASGEDLFASIYFDSEDAETSGAYKKTTLIYECGWFECPMLAIGVDKSTITF